PFASRLRDRPLVPGLGPAPLDREVSRLQPLDGPGQGVPADARRGGPDPPAPSGRQRLPSLPTLLPGAGPQHGRMGGGSPPPTHPWLSDFSALLLEGRSEGDPRRVPDHTLSRSLLQLEGRDRVGWSRAPARHDVRVVPVWRRPDA